jgi:O-antigen ligase
VVVVVGWFLLLAPAASRGHISNLQTGRTTLWMLAGRTIAANPVVGVGNDNFAVTSSSYLIRPGVTNDALQVVIDPKVAHNVYLELWADLGIVGLALFSALVLASLRSATAAVRVFERNGNRGEGILARALVVALVAMLAADFFVSNLYSKQLFLLLALGPTMLSMARGQARSEPA